MTALFWICSIAGGAALGYFTGVVYFTVSRTPWKLVAELLSKTAVACFLCQIMLRCVLGAWLSEASDLSPLAGTVSTGLVCLYVGTAFARRRYRGTSCLGGFSFRSVLHPELLRELHLT